MSTFIIVCLAVIFIALIVMIYNFILDRESSIGAAMLIIIVAVGAFGLGLGGNTIPVKKFEVKEQIQINELEYTKKGINVYTQDYGVIEFNLI